MATCTSRQFNRYPKSIVRTKKWFKDKGLIDEFYNVLNLAGFRKFNTHWSKEANNKYNVSGRLYVEDANGTKIIPNEDMFKQLDKLIGGSNQKEISSFQLNEVKEGVDFIFEEDPELSNIGSQQQYSAYLETIFPNSKVEDIVYHGSPSKFDLFKRITSQEQVEKQLGGNYYGEGFYFMNDTSVAKKFGKNIYSVVLDLKNPLTAEETKSLAEIWWEEYTSKGGSSNPDNLSLSQWMHKKIVDEDFDGMIELNKEEDFRVGEKRILEYMVPSEEQIHILGSKQDIKRFKKFITSNNYQLDNNINTPPNDKIESIIKSWLTKVGIKYDPVDKIYTVNGVEIDAVAKADILNKTIEIVEGKRNLHTLPEEAAHMLVRMIGIENSLVKAMMNNIDQYQVYDDVVNSPYGELYKNDDDKLREEAVGKLISQIIVAQETGENMPAAKEVNRWNQMWNWLVNRLKKLIGTPAQDDLLEFTMAANIITEQVEPMISEEWKEETYEPSAVFYELNTEKTTQIINSLKSTGIHYDAQKEAYFGPNGRRITKRVTQLVKKLDANRFKRQAETELTPTAKLAAAGGTVVHSYMNQLTRHILNATNGDLTKIDTISIPKSKIEKDAKEELLSNPNIKDRGEKFIELSDLMYGELRRDVVSRLKHIQTTQEFINKETGENGKAEILPEFIIYDPVRDVAGTIDLLVIYSNSKTSIYDYKG